jgi:pyruvate dehydrogenase E1 component beta subunit
MPWSRFEKQWSIQEDGRRISYKDAIREAVDQAMCLDPKVFAIGLDADDCYGVYGTMLGLSHPERVLGTPISENAMTGVALGAALTGMRPIHIHMRVDFLPVAMDQITNYVSKWKAMFGGKPKVPLVIRAVVGRGWGCGAQHSQTLHGMFAHLPGLKVVTPATPRDAKGLLLQAISEDEPVLFLEHRWLYKNEGAVPEEMFTIPFGKGTFLRRGKALTLVAPSLAAIHALKACEEHDLDVDLIDPRTIKPLDRELILESVHRTGKVLVVDYDSPVCGFASEVLALVSEGVPSSLPVEAERITFPDIPMPASGVLERKFYPDSERIAEKIKSMLGIAQGEKAMV